MPKSVYIYWRLENVNLHKTYIHLSYHCNRMIPTFHIGFIEENYIQTKVKELGELFRHCMSMFPCYGITIRNHVSSMLLSKLLSTIMVYVLMGIASHLENYSKPALPLDAAQNSTLPTLQKSMPPRLPLRKIYK